MLRPPHPARRSSAGTTGSPAVLALALPALALLAGPHIAWAARSAPASASTAAAAPAASAAAGRDRFTHHGLTPASAGQTLAQAEAALGQALKPLPAPRGKSAASAASAGMASAGACHYRATDAQPGVRYALAGDVITRIETRDTRYATVSGVHVGDTVARAQQAYGKRLALAPHPYFDKGHTLTVYSSDRRFALVMEANDQGRIITLRGGRLPEVAWLEGCS